MKLIDKINSMSTVMFSMVVLVSIAVISGIIYAILSLLKNKGTGVKNVKCPKGCSGNGECISGKCKCTTGFSGVDCYTPDHPVYNNKKVYLQVYDGGLYSKQFGLNGLYISKPTKKYAGSVLKHNSFLVMDPSVENAYEFTINGPTIDNKYSIDILNQNPKTSKNFCDMTNVNTQYQNYITKCVPLYTTTPVDLLFNYKSKGVYTISIGNKFLSGTSIFKTGFCQVNSHELNFKIIPVNK
jgi:hypothetical protein